MKDSEKKRILEMHYNAKNKKSLFEQQTSSLYVDRCCQPPASGEYINKTHDDVWDYKKVGDKYYARKKCTQWVEATGTARESIKNNVNFGDGTKIIANPDSQMETMPTRGNPRDLGQMQPQDNLPSIDRQYRATDIRNNAY